MSKKIYSYEDTRGHLFVDCSECTRGGNGSEKDKCSAGAFTTKGAVGGCFAGTLMDEIETEMPVNEYCQKCFFRENLKCTVCLTALHMLENGHERPKELPPVKRRSGKCKWFRASNGTDRPQLTLL